MLALPTIKGAKSPSERFAGADDTYTIEAMMQNGWALQSGTSHFLGQNFARAFDVHYQNASEGRELVWATSWGVSTRLIGAYFCFRFRFLHTGLLLRHDGFFLNLLLLIALI
jgi:prolyl-tRNA synthetase